MKTTNPFKPNVQLPLFGLLCMANFLIFPEALLSPADFYSSMARVRKGRKDRGAPSGHFGATHYKGGKRKEDKGANEVSDLLYIMERFFSGKKETSAYEFNAEKIRDYDSVKSLPLEVRRKLAQNWKIPMNSIEFDFRVTVAMTNLKLQLIADKLGRPTDMVDPLSTEVRKKYAQTLGLRVSEDGSFRNWTKKEREASRRERYNAKRREKRRLAREKPPERKLSN